MRTIRELLPRLSDDAVLALIDAAHCRGEIGSEAAFRLEAARRKLDARTGVRRCPSAIIPTPAESGR